jgi:hypothetical protein
MKRFLPFLTHVLFVCAVLVFGAACTPQSPIIIFVTPTPGTAATAPATQAAAIPTVSMAVTADAVTADALSATSSPTPTASATASPTPPPTEPPTATLAPTLFPTNTPPPPTRDPALPTSTIMGSVVGPSYALPLTQPPPAPPTGDPAVLPPIEPTLPPDGAAPTATPETAALVMPNLDRERIGVQLDINLSVEDWNDAMSRIETLGVRWVKVQVPWRDMQPTGPDERDNPFFRLVEQHLEEAARRGFNVMVSVVKAPAWARSVQAEDGPPDDPEQLARFITLILNEFNAGLARPMLGEYIDAVEIWNEPNLIREWQGTLPFDGAGYMRLFAPAYAAVRAYSPTLPVITAGLAPTGNTGGSIDDRTYLRQMFAAGLGGYADVVIGAHPYSWGNAPTAVCCGTRGWDDDPHFFFADTMREYRAILAENGTPNRPIWITEFGYATWDGLPGDPPPGSEWMRFNDRYQQGLYTIETLRILQEKPDTGPTILWNLNFGVLAGLIENRDERVAYSMVLPGTLGQIDPASQDRTERPLFWMLYDAVRPDVTLPSF